jgi:hypothetical protein
MRRREFISMIAGATAWPLGARADQPAMPVIGFLNPAPAAEAIPHLVAAFRRGLAEAGYVIHCRDVPHVRQHVERRCAGCGHPILPFCSRCRLDNRQNQTFVLQDLDGHIRWLAR